MAVNSLIDTRDLARTVHCPFRGEQNGGKYEQKGLQVIQSLRLRNDPRYQEIEHYTLDDGHFTRMLEGKGLDGKALSGKEKKAPSVTQKSPDGRSTPDHAIPVQDRVHWQRSFDRSVKRLLIDFDLSDEPSNRLHHLDRMYDWFTQHGGKQQRKAKPPPNFLVIEKNAVVPAGSTKNVSGNLSNTSFILAGSIAMRRSKNVPDLPSGAKNIYNQGPKSAR